MLFGVLIKRPCMRQKKVALKNEFDTRGKGRRLDKIIYYFENVSTRFKKCKTIAPCAHYKRKTGFLYSVSQAVWFCVIFNDRINWNTTYFRNLRTGVGIFPPASPWCIYRPTYVGPVKPVKPLTSLYLRVEYISLLLSFALCVVTVSGIIQDA